MDDSDVRLRKLAWDIIPCPAVPSMLPVFGLVPGSEDISELEHRDAHVRLDVLAPIQEHLVSQSTLAAKVVTAVMLRLDINQDTDPRLVETVECQNASAIHGGLIAIVAQLFDDGVIQYKVPQ